MKGSDNLQVRLARRPIGLPDDSVFDLVHEAVPEPTEGQVLIRTLWLSVDPYMRGRMNDAPSYIPPFRVGEVLEGGVVGQVVQSRNPRFQEGEIVTGMLGWQSYSLSDGRGLGKVHPTLAPITAALHVLGIPGLTAYFGLLDIGRPKAGETVVISGAAGAVGSVVGQIAKLKGCRVVGLAGSDDKIAWLTGDLGFDAGINYRTQKLRAAVKEACPDGVDVYFDNVGGAVSDAVLLSLNDFARVPLCGQISLYNADGPETGPRLLPLFVQRRVLMQGFIATDYAARFAEAQTELSQWLRDGKLSYRETVVDGIEQAPEAFRGLFRGDNTGKLLVKVADARSEGQ